MEILKHLRFIGLTNDIRNQIKENVYVFVFYVGRCLQSNRQAFFHCLIDRVDYKIECISKFRNHYEIAGILHGCLSLWQEYVMALLLNHLAFCPNWQGLINTLAVYTSSLDFNTLWHFLKDMQTTIRGHQSTRLICCQHILKKGDPLSDKSFGPAYFTPDEKHSKERIMKVNL